jgi:hypothetical protein
MPHHRTKTRRDHLVLRIIAGVTLLLGIWIFPPILYSQEVYRWTDEQGTVHFTDDPSRIPDRYRSQSEKKEMPREPQKDRAEPVKPEVKSDTDRVKKYLEEMDRKIAEKKILERRISELEETLRSHEERLKEIEELEKEDFQYYQPFRDPRTGKWVNVASPYYDEKRRLEANVNLIKGEIESLYEKLTKINRSL